MAFIVRRVSWSPISLFSDLIFNFFSPHKVNSLITKELLIILSLLLMLLRFSLRITILLLIFGLKVLFFKFVQLLFFLVVFILFKNYLLLFLVVVLILYFNYAFVIHWDMVILFMLTFTFPFFLVFSFLRRIPTIYIVADFIFSYLDGIPTWWFATFIWCILVNFGIFEIQAKV